MFPDLLEVFQVGGAGVLWQGGAMPPDDEHLKPEDRRVWRRVARTVRHKETPKSAVPSASRAEFAAMMRVPVKPRVSPPRPGPLEPTAAKAVRRGRVDVGVKVDLHDLTLAKAYPFLVTRLHRAHERGVRCALVITGKGVRLDGKLRAALPGWLAGPELRPIVATYAQAHQRDGGAGAWYVFLKRNRT